jgi:hypothetical protein
MDKPNEPAQIKYTKRILELIEREIIEINGDLSRIDTRMMVLWERKRVLYNERRNILKELRKAESECCVEPNVPILTFKELK